MIWGIVGNAHLNDTGSDKMRHYITKDNTIYNIYISQYNIYLLK